MKIRGRAKTSVLLGRAWERINSPLSLQSLALEHLIIADWKFRSQIFSKTSATKDLPPEVPNRAVTLALLTRPDRAMLRSPLYGDIS
jgi:hypothetical protein